MDSNKGAMLLIALLISVLVFGIIYFIVKAFDAGGLFHGRWIEKGKPSHVCKEPYYFMGEVGNTWQCHKCKQIWIRQQLGWKEMK